MVNPHDQPVLLLDPLSSFDVDHLVEVELFLVGVLGPIDHSGTILLSQGQSLKLPVGTLLFSNVYSTTYHEHCSFLSQGSLFFVISVYPYR